MIARSLAIVALALAGCNSEAAPTVMTEPDGAFAFGALEHVEPTVEPGRSAWRMRNGVVVTTQRLEVTEGRSIDSVANALVERYSIGEVRGALTRSDCTVAGQDAACFHGWMHVTRDGRSAQWARRGVLLDLGTHLVLVEALGSADHRALVDRQGDLLERTLSML